MASMILFRGTEVVIGLISKKFSKDLSRIARHFSMAKSWNFSFCSFVASLLIILSIICTFSSVCWKTPCFITTRTPLLLFLPTRLKACFPLSLCTKPPFPKVHPDGYVTLTPAGKKIAKEIESRHIFLRDFFYRILKVDKDTADRTACRMEHALDKQTFKKFKDFLKKVDSCPHSDIKPCMD